MPLDALHASQSMNTRFDPERFVSLRKLSRGDMTELYRAEDSQLGRVLTFKLLHTDRAYDPQAQDLLEHEARLLARIDHTNVVALHDLGSLGDEPCLTLGPVGRLGLPRWLDAEARSDGQILAVLLQAGRGLAAAHQAGVVHCNLDPEQLRIDDRGHVRLVNFELGRELQPQPTAWERDQPRFEGNPDYMAPEARKVGRRDATADQYSFCVIAWEAMTGQRSPHDLQAAARNGGRRLRAVLTVLARGLAPQPADRWPDVASLIDALERCAPVRSPGRRGLTLLVVATVVAAVVATVVTAVVALNLGLAGQITP